MEKSEIFEHKKIFEYGNKFSNKIYNKILSLLDEKDTDLHIQENGEIYKKDYKGIRSYVGNNIVTPQEIMALGALLAIRNDTELNMHNPMLDAYIPYDNARVHIDIPPITARPVLDLRLFHENYQSLDALMGMGMFTETDKEKLINIVNSQKI